MAMRWRSRTGTSCGVMTARWIGLPAAGGARFALGAGAVGVLGYERETEVVARWNVGVGGGVVGR